MYHKVLYRKVNSVVDRVGDHDLFLFSSSIAYYSALGFAPFMLILLWLASLVGQNIQRQIVINVRQNMSDQVADMIQLVFRNINEGVDIGSISGFIGLFVLLWTCSLVFLQLRYAFDVIYGTHDPHYRRSFLQWGKERLYAMFIVLLAALLLVCSFTMVAIVEYYVSDATQGATFYRILLFLVNFLIYLALFTLIHYLTPSHRPRKRVAMKIAALSSFFFIIGNFLLATYLRAIAVSSVYGAAGTLLVFLIWAYYSAFTLFLSVELYDYLRRIGRIRA